MPRHHFVHLLLAGSFLAVGANIERVELQPGVRRVWQVPVGTGELLISSPKPGEFTAGSRVSVQVSDASGRSAAKDLHAGDIDFHFLAPTRTTKLTVGLLSHDFRGTVEIRHTAVRQRESRDAQIATGFRTTWQSAEPIRLGRTVYASGDDRPYIPSLGAFADTFAQMMSGIHWYRLDHKGPGEILVHFNLEILDRDVPSDLAVFRLEAGKPVEYTRGRERFEPEKSTNFHGLYKFVPRVLTPGAYFVRVMANHPAYQLQIDAYPVPPYTEPRQAVRTAMDYILRKGDSWHSNTPRKGSVVLRTSSPLQETRVCIACHPTHFSTRGALFAVDNGYPVRARSSLQFLVERLYNNPRPLYGKTDASWARMIHAPGNVLSRVAYLVNGFERSIGGERREELHRGIAGYLEMYWPGMTAPGHESNGNQPRISGFEVALHNALFFEDLHKRTGESKYLDLRRRIEEIVVAGAPDDNLDLAWKLDALVTFDRKRHQPEIHKLVEELFRRQQPDGTWAMPFDMEEVQYDFARQRVNRRRVPVLEGQQGPRASDFQTYHAIYALARAGVTLEDPRLKKAVDLCLARQTPSGAWQGRPDYKNFDTPFRDTQYALMALSTLFPAGEPARGWNAGFAPPSATFDESSEAALLATLDQYWDKPADPVIGRIRRLLQSPSPMVRYRAAVALGRFADPNSLESLAAKLGDPSKIVQRGAAWAVRQIVSRRPEARGPAIAILRASLNSTDERVRWGATRVFNQHFKYFSEEWTLGEELLRMASSEPVPAVRMAAIQALYQWWFWDRSAEHKAAIEETLIVGLGKDAHPWVRRNLIEAYYQTLDDNVRYLYGSWIPRVKRAEDRAAIDAAHKQHVRLQAVRYRDSMARGNTLARDGLLRALYTFHVREGLGDVAPLAGATLPETVAGSWVNGYKWAALYDPLTGGSGGAVSIGNDSEGPAFYSDSAPVMQEALLAALDDNSPQIFAGVLRTLKFLRLRIDAPLATRILARLDKPSAEIAALTAAAMTLAPVDDPAVREAIRSRWSKVSVDDRDFPVLVDLLPRMTGLRRDESILARVAEGLGSRRPQPQQAVLRLVFGDPDVLSSQAMRAAWDGFPEKRGSMVVGGALSAMGALNWRDSRYKPALPEVRRIVLAGLSDPVATVRTQALETLRTIDPLQSDREITSRVTALRADPDRHVRIAALGMDSVRLLRGAGRSPDAMNLLDYFYFKDRVEPILLAKGADGYSCANCHANHTLLKLNEGDDFGITTLSESRANFNAAAAMVNARDPENSLLLNKPVSPLDDEGVGDSQALSHGGGPRWQGKQNSPEYQTILRWIRGARLESRASAE